MQMLISFSRLLRWVRNHNANAIHNVPPGRDHYKWLGFLVRACLGGISEGLYTVALIGSKGVYCISAING
jgi:hypothetical protein